MTMEACTSTTATPSTGGSPPFSGEAGGSLSPSHVYSRRVEDELAVELVAPEGRPHRTTVAFFREEDKALWKDIFDCPHFQQWLKAYAVALANPSGLRLHSVTILSADTKEHADGQREVSSLHINAHITDSKGNTIPGDVHLHGARSAVVVLLRNTENNKDMCVFVKQPRPNIGEHDFLEIPDCTLTLPEGHFIGPAAELLEQALGVSLTRSSTVNLTGLAFGAKSEGVCSSPGTSDERVQIYLYRNNLPPAEMNSLELKVNGKRGLTTSTRGREEGMEKEEEAESTEKVEVSKDGLELRMVTLGDAWRSTSDAKSMVALFLVHELRYHARMPRYKPPREMPNGVMSHRTGEHVEKKSASFVKVGSLEPTSVGVNLRVKIVKKLEVEEDQMRKDQMRKQRVGQLSVGDETAIVLLRLVNDQIRVCETLECDTPLIVRNAKIDMSDGHMKLMVDRWGKITRDIDEENMAEFSFAPNVSQDISKAEYELVVLDEQNGDGKREDGERRKSGGRRGGRRGGGGRKSMRGMPGRGGGGGPVTNDVRGD